jgi:glutamate carboxypeptidase
MKMADKILHFLKEEEKNALFDLERYVKIESPSTSPSSLFNAYHFLIEQFKKLNYFTNWIPGKESGGYLYARPLKRIKKSEIQLIIGHTDTVWPLGTIGKMPVKKENDKMYGPGIYDMKSGIIQLIYALNSIQKLKFKPEVLPVILINSDEEVGSKESTSIISRLSKIACRAFILEPSLGLEGKLKTRRLGVSKYIFKIEGKAAHAGLDPTKGASAIIELSHIIQKLASFNKPIKGVSVNVGMIEGGTRANVIAAESSAIVDVRVPSISMAKKMDIKIKNIKPRDPGVKIEIIGGIGRPPMEATRRNELLWKLAKKNAALLNIDLKEGTAGGGSDGNTCSQFTASLDGLGSVGDGAHANYEHIFQSKLIERSALLSLLIMEGAMISKKN